MRKVVLITLAVLLLSSCGVSTPQSLYYWGGTDTDGVTKYEELAYKDYKSQTPEALCNLVCAYENIVSHPGGSRAVPPPGICAEYGYLLLQEATVVAFAQKATASQKKVFGVDDYSAFFTQRGQEMLQKEIEYYPEAAKFLRPLINKFAR